MGAHSVVLELLQIPYEKVQYMNLAYMSVLESNECGARRMIFC